MFVGVGHASASAQLEPHVRLPRDTFALTREQFCFFISVMTEITEKTGELSSSIERFVVAWGELGEVWGVNRSVSQIHALLYASDRPLSADEIVQSLKIARSNVSNSLRELVGWSLVRRVSVLGDRRDFYEAEADVFELVRRIAEGRKKREIDPAIAALRQCVNATERDNKVSLEVRRRFRAMLSVTEGAARNLDEVLALPTPVLQRLVKMGGVVTRLAALVSGGRGSRGHDASDR